MKKKNKTNWTELSDNKKIDMHSFIFQNNYDVYYVILHFLFMRIF